MLSVVSSSFLLSTKLLNYDSVLHNFLNLSGSSSRSKQGAAAEAAKATNGSESSNIGEGDIGRRNSSDQTRGSHSNSSAVSASCQPTAVE
jgi:hypothetical protein